MVMSPLRLLVRQLCQRLVPLLCAGILILGLATPSQADPDRSPGRPEVAERLGAIATQMEEIRLCNRPGCRYKDIDFKVLDPDASSGSDVLYRGVIDAVIDRPADTVDKAHYNLEFRQDRWHLVSGEELSDVSSFFFSGDTFEVFSSYSGRTRVDKLANASPKLRVGYRVLYQRVTDQGVERLEEG